MAFPSVTFTFTNGSNSDATQVNQNFTDVLNAFSDGTKDINIFSATIAGALTANGNVNLGDSTVDSLTITASLASTVAIKTNNSFDIGSASLGLGSIYYGSSGGFTTRIVGGATSSWTMTLPTTGGTSGYHLRTNGSGTTNWVNPYGPYGASNYGLAASVSSNILTVALKGADGNDPSATNPVDIVFRNATSTTGTPIIRTATAATSMTISNGSSLGQASGANQYVWVYAIDNAGTIELAVAGAPFTDELAVVTTTTEGGGGTATSGTTIYSGTTRSNVGVRLLGRLKSNQATAGTWASSILEISLAAALKNQMPRSEVFLQNGNGHGSTNNKIRRFTNTTLNYGTAITYADSAANGASLTINEDGVYGYTYADSRSGGAADVGVSNNSNQLTTAIGSISGANHVNHNTTGNSGFETCASGTLWLRAGDVIRPHTDGSPDSTNAPDSHFRLLRLA